jgi:hypothetical protein
MGPQEVDEVLRRGLEVAVQRPHGEDLDANRHRGDAQRRGGRE